jgi:hypothetical protein
MILWPNGLDIESATAALWWSMMQLHALKLPELVFPSTTKPP